MLILCDIDGTAADITHRRHFVENKPKRWDKFYDAMIYDTPNMWCAYLLQAVIYDGHEIVFISGRPDNYREQTETWLKKFYPFCADNLIVHMRPANNTEPDYVIKERTYDAEFANKDVLFVIDDRQQVVDMWRRRGLTVLQCDEGNF
jgi:hypothetical protein